MFGGLAFGAPGQVLTGIDRFMTNKIDTVALFVEDTRCFMQESYRGCHGFTFRSPNAYRIPSAVWVWRRS